MQDFSVRLKKWGAEGPVHGTVFTLEDIYFVSIIAEACPNKLVHQICFQPLEVPPRPRLVPLLDFFFRDFAVVILDPGPTPDVVLPMRVLDNIRRNSVLQRREDNLKHLARSHVLYMRWCLYVGGLADLKKLIGIFEVRL